MFRQPDKEPRFHTLDSIGVPGKKYWVEQTVYERGGMGEIWIAYDPVLRKKVAIKTGIPSAEFNGFSVSREARVHAATNNRFIIPLYDFVKIDEGVGIVMQYVDPERAYLLDEYLYAKELSQADLLTIVKQLGEFVDSYASKGHFHRDLKLNNVFFFPKNYDRYIRVIDLGFGGDVATDHEVRKNNEVVGTPYFMSPQRLEGLETKLSDEVYAVGVMLYLLLTQSVDYLADDLKKQHAFAVSVKNFGSDMGSSKLLHAWGVDSGAVAAVLERAMHPVETQRYPSGASLYQALESALASKRVGAVRQ